MYKWLLQRKCRDGYISNKNNSRDGYSGIIYFYKICDLRILCPSDFILPCVLFGVGETIGEEEVAG